MKPSIMLDVIAPKQLCKCRSYLFDAYNYSNLKQPHVNTDINRNNSEVNIKQTTSKFNVRKRSQSVFPPIIRMRIAHNIHIYGTGIGVPNANPIAFHSRNKLSMFPYMKKPFLKSSITEISKKRVIKIENKDVLRKINVRGKSMIQRKAQNKYYSFIQMHNNKASPIKVRLNMSELYSKLNISIADNIMLLPKIKLDWAPPAISQHVSIYAYNENILL